MAHEAIDLTTVTPAGDLTTVDPAGDHPDQAVYDADDTDDTLVVAGREACDGFSFVVPWFAEAWRAPDDIFGRVW